MQIKYTVNENNVDVKLIGELDTPATEEIQPCINELLALGSKQLTFDCSALEYIASSGLRQFIMVHKKCKAEGGHLRLMNVKPDVMEIFTATSFDKVFDII